jgi:hypothetical protein
MSNAVVVLESASYRCGQPAQFLRSKRVGLPAQPNAVAVTGIAGEDVHVKVENVLLAGLLVGLDQC